MCLTHGGPGPAGHARRHPPDHTYGETLRPAPWELQRPLQMEGVWLFLRVQPPKLKPQILMD